MSTERYPLVRMPSKTHPKEAALGALKRNDLKAFCLVLDSLDPLSLPPPFPLPETHWINRPIEDDNDDDPKTILMVALLEAEDEAFCKKLVQVGADANLFSPLLGLAPLHYAVHSGSAAKVRALLEVDGNRADPDLQTQDAAQSSLHLAAEAGLADVLEALLETPPMPPNVNAHDAFGLTPLFVAAQEGHEACVRMLLEHGGDLQFRGGPDRLSVIELIRRNLPGLDLTDRSLYTPKPFTRKTPEDLDEFLRTDNFTLFKYSLKYVSAEALSKTVVSNMTLLQRACDSGRHQFVQALLDAGADPNFSKAKSSRPVLIAAEKAHPLVLAKLKQSSAKNNGPKFDIWNESTQETVLHMALKKEYVRALIGGIGTPEQIKDYEKRYSECLDILLSRENESYNKQIRLIINKLDDRGNTPLHYATTAGWSQAVVRKLLDLGANIGVKNWRGEIPLTRIHPQTLSDFLDEECLQGASEIHSNEDFPIIINYSFLAPPVTEDQLKEWDAEQQAEIERKALPETNCVWHMSNSPTHRHLVTHPVVKSFLWLKWQRIRRFFNLNLRFYSLFVALLTWYIFARFAGHEWNNRIIFTNPGFNQSAPGNVSVEFCSDILWNESRQRIGFWYVIFVLHSIVQGVFMFREYLKETQFCTKCKCNYSSVFAGWIDLSMASIIGLVLWGASGILWLALTFLIALMCGRESLQMTSSFKRYWTSIENWVETALIGIVLFIIYFPDDGFESSCSVKRCLAAFAILLSWAELITMVGRHPHLSLYNKYVTMFYKVLRSFFSFLVWYSFFLVAFGLGFYIMLHSDGAPKTQKEDEEENEFFQNPWLSLVKTSTMFIGELEFSDIHIYREPSTSAKVLGYIFLLLFVFLIVVVLMNLLNGLAVSDTAGIEREANIICHISKAETISYAESVLLGDPFDFLDDNNSSRCNPFKGSSFCSYFRNLAQKMLGATGILLFYTYLTEKKIEFPLDPGHSDDGCLRDYECCRSIKMAKSMQLDAEYRDILFEARKIIARCSEQFKEKDYISSITELLQQIMADQKLMTATIFKQNEEISALRKTLKMLTTK